MNEKKRKARDNPQPYARKPWTKVNKNPPATSAKSAEKKGRENLTLHDWLTVFKFIDAHLDLPQADIVAHFKTLKEGALVFSQSALSRNIKRQSELEEQVESNPTALSAKHLRIVTRPDVERALVLWICSMEERVKVWQGRCFVWSGKSLRIALRCLKMNGSRVRVGLQIFARRKLSTVHCYKIL